MKGKRLFFIVIFLLLCSVLISCREKEPVKRTEAPALTESPRIEGYVYPFSANEKEKPLSYLDFELIVYPDGNDHLRTVAEALEGAIKEKNHKNISSSNDKNKSDREIIIGYADREECLDAYLLLDTDGYIVAPINEKLVILGTSPKMTEEAVEFYIDTFDNEQYAITKNVGYVYREGSEHIKISPALTADIKEKSGEISVSVELGTISCDRVCVSVFTNVGVKPVSKEYTLTEAVYKNGVFVTEDLKTDALDFEGEAYNITVSLYMSVGEDKIYGRGYTAFYNDGRLVTEEDIEGENGQITISNEAEFLFFASKINKYRFSNVKLTRSLSFEHKDGYRMLSPIGSEDISFDGTFDGGDNSITGLFIRTVGDNLGLFECVGEGGVIKNLTLKNTYLFADSNKYVGSLTAILKGKIKNISVDTVVSTLDPDGNKGSYIKKGSMKSLGGVVGKMCGDTLAQAENVVFSGKIDVSGMYVTICGGVVGSVSGVGARVSLSVFSGEIDYLSDYTSGYGVTALAGIVGDLSSGIVYGCKNTGIINDRSKTNTIVGGVVGIVSGAGRITDCECSYSAAIVHYGNSRSSVGGIVGGFTGNVGGAVTARCASMANIKGGFAYVGGVVGYVGKRAFVSACYSLGDVLASEGGKIAKTVGGLVGYIGNNKFSLSGSYFIGSLSGEAVGGLVGELCEDYRYITDDGYRFLKASFWSLINSNDNVSICDAGNRSEALFLSDIEGIVSFYGENKDFYNPYIISSEKKSPCFDWQCGSSPSEALPSDIAVIHSENDIENSASSDEYYYVKKYVSYISDGESVSVEDFFASLGKSSREHRILDDDGKETEEKCSCALFGGQSHRLPYESWCRLLSVVNKYIPIAADIANYGEIKHIDKISVDKLASGTYGICRRRFSTIYKCEEICFSSLYYREELRESTVLHELIHAMSSDINSSEWIIEGYATFMTHTLIPNEEVLSYKWSSDGERAPYTPTAALYDFIKTRYGDLSTVVLRELGALGSGDSDLLFYECFGITYSDMFNNLFRSYLNEKNSIGR